MLFHVVARGETLWGISRRYGLKSWTALYTYEQNKTFRATRPDPNLIHPGDILYIPTLSQPKPVRRPRRNPYATDPISIDIVSTGKNEIEPTAASKMTAAEVQKRGIGLNEAAGLIGNVLGGRRFAFGEFLGDLKGGQFGKGADIAQATAEFIQAYGNFAMGKKTDGFASFLAGTGTLFTVLPKGTTDKWVTKITRGFRRIPKLEPLANVLGDLAKIGAIGDLTALLSSLLTLNVDGVCNAGNNIVNKFKANPQVAATACLPITEFLVNLLPQKLKVKMGSKMIGRKVPVVGTVVVGLFDVVDIISAPTDWKKWAGLGSTVAGLFPGVGTAGSIVIDLAILIGTLSDEIQNLEFNIS